MGWWALVALAVGAACGRVGFDERGARPDASFTTRHWVNRNDGTPGALLSPKLVYHETRGTVIMYGGDTPTRAVAAMWELLPTGWVLLCDPCAPGERFAHTMAYDAARDRIVLFGGIVAAPGDLWEWDGATWMEMTPGGAVPARRDFAQLVYDRVRRRSVLVGGAIAGVPDDAIYEYDGATWFLASAAGGGPGAVAGNGTEIAYNELDGRVYVLGDDDTNFRDDLWTWDTTSWSRVCSLCTGRARNDASIMFDVALEKLWLTGGFDGGEIPGTSALAGNVFQPVDVLPPERDSVGVAYDRARNTIVVYGGNGVSCGDANCAETWEFVPD